MTPFPAAQLPMSFIDVYEPTKGTTSHGKHFGLGEVFLGITEKRVCRQIRYQTPIPPSLDPTSKTQGAMGTEGAVGKVSDRSYGPALFIPLSPLEPGPLGIPATETNCQGSLYLHKLQPCLL